jgi:hypothetical protein
VEPVLLTDRLAPRRLTAADAGNPLALDGDPAPMVFWPDAARDFGVAGLGCRLRREDWIARQA